MTCADDADPGHVCPLCGKPLLLGWHTNAPDSLTCAELQEDAGEEARRAPAAPDGH